MSSTPTTFPNFSLLAPGLRRKIWQASIQDLSAATYRYLGPDCAYLTSTHEENVSHVNSEARAVVSADRANQKPFYVWTSESPKTLLGIPDTVPMTWGGLEIHLSFPANLAKVTATIKSNPQLRQAHFIAVDGVPGASDLGTANYHRLAIMTLIEQMTADPDICPDLEEVLPMSSLPVDGQRIYRAESRGKTTRQKLMDLRESRPLMSVSAHSST